MRKLADEGFELAYVEIGNIYELGTGGVDQDLEKAIRWYQKSIQSNAPDSAAHLGLGRIYLQSEDSGTRSKAYSHFFQVRDVELGALFALGEMHNRGIGVELDRVEALKYFKAAASNGHITANSRLIQLSASDGGLFGRLRAWIKSRIFVFKSLKRHPEITDNRHPLVGVATSDVLNGHNKSLKADAVNGAS
jgi:hypothetical protein